MAVSFTEVFTSEKDDILCNFAITEAFIEGIRSSESFHFHSRYELFAVKKGEMRIASDRREYHLGEGDVVIIPPGITHYVYDDKDSVRTGFLFEFMPSKKGSENTFLSEFRDTFQKITDITVTRCPDLYEWYLTSAIRSVAKKEPRYAVADLLFLTLDYAKRQMNDCINLEGRVEKPSNELLSVCIENFMNSTYASPPDISELANELGYSVRHTQRVIEKLFGMSYSRLLTKKRVAAACFLLRNTDKPLEEIALQTGFCSLSHLCHAFKGAMNTTPLAYRNERMQVGGFE